MFPKLADLINYLFGSHIDFPVQTYGFFLSVAFIVGGFVLRAELKRKENEGLLAARVINYSPDKQSGWFQISAGIVLSSVFGWKFFGIILNYREFALDPQLFIVSGRGSIAALLIIFTISSVYHIYKKITIKKTGNEALEELIHPYQNTWNIMVIAIISALIGSKLFDILDNFSSFLQHPMHSLLSFRGLTFYGGFIVTVIVMLLYMKVIKLDWKHVIDCSAPVIMIGYAIGRLGCHFSGDGCWGIVNGLTQPHGLAWLPDWLWASSYPHNVANHGVPIPGCLGAHCLVLENPVFPTSLYESIISFLSFGILWIMRKKIKAPVALFGLFMILNGTERFWIEKIRINHKYNFLGMQLTQAEMISALLIVIGIAVIIYFSRRYKAQYSEKLIE